MTTTSTGPDTTRSTGTRTAPRRRGDLVFSGTALAAGIIILVTLAAVAVFLIVQAIPALSSDTSNNHILEGQSFLSWVWPFVFGTLWSSFIALVIAAPIAIGIALFISHYAPRRLAGVLGYIIDLLAAVPSVVFGLWGALTFAPMLVPFYKWLNTNLGFIPLFSGTPSGTGKTILTASLVLAVMILPIMTAICREVFLQTPKLHEEAALALGATRWEMVRMAVLPFARSGMVSGAMLGLGRALGETMAVTLVLSPLGIVTFNLINPENPTTIPAIIALRFPEAHDEGVNTLIAAGLILFIVTFAVNFVARWIVSRRAEFSGAN
ncbi:phosphate ABC transporter permease subunit PstC [Microbacterium sp. 1.5R]|uniref:phosphate ABC transporter permease subunit PstC n=1 Tax=Microbacterium TaxID=33882 RepID=UPI00069E226D|nr:MULTISPECIES: phosphate ABC transporter permease subunit PstC [unclassified Microbacterium]AKV86229.1 phosphate ABC transporter permease [Microbacterium sp. CGR1]APH45666.1 phosphate ABC transporter permease subunit PstC [Microbacterium sp. 1.5R]KRD50847.1 phosphate ABC transporter permease [Microbacterium sp. Root280D1]MBC6496345.1 phosphate ABC transporter permease subunit PstC [Microbacterium sp. 4-7]CAH0130525.1 Phosphate transport system permease protein PstC 2 [Microbacterium sp. Bi98